MTKVERKLQSSEESASQSSSELPHDCWKNVGDDLTMDHLNIDFTQSSSWQEEAHWMSFRHEVQKFAWLKSSTAIQGDDDDVDSEESVEWNYVQGLSSPGSSSSETSALASDLAETRMRLALAQAERDELEFVLLQQSKQF